ncbi:MAG: HAMP domain-containing sensor histidine kinase [Phycisphaerae bacterium]
MSIRLKVALLVLAFELVLCATLTLTVRYIGAYFNDAAQAFHGANTSLAEVGRLRTLLRTQLLALVDFDGQPDDWMELSRIGREVESAAPVAHGRIESAAGSARAGRFDELMRRAAHVAGERIAAGAATGKFDSAPHLALDAELGEVEAVLLRASNSRVEEVFAGQRRAVLILWINAAVGVAIGVLGIVLLRRWVLTPIERLAATAVQIGRGRLDARADVPSGDEFGELAATMNKMSADLARIERQLVQRERLAAMGELIAYVAHNIRNPLAGIQAAAEAARRQTPPELPVWANLDAIVAATDKFHAWLRQLEHTCSPLELRAEPVALSGLVENVTTVFRPMADRRAVTVSRALDPAVEKVWVDPRHFEHALAALLGNAIEAAATPDGRVEIRTARAADGRHWTLTVWDNGPGIDPAVIDRIFEPTYSKKRTGHGLGLLMARKIVELHGGQIAVESGRGDGTRFLLLLPEPAGDGNGHG